MVEKCQFALGDSVGIYYLTLNSSVWLCLTRYVLATYFLLKAPTHTYPSRSLKLIK